MEQGPFLAYVDPWINWDWLSTHISLVLGALGEHIELTAIALGAGLLIAVPLGVAAHRSAGLRLAALGFFGAFYTIPSLALFALLIPFTHLGGTTAEIPLIGHNVSILVRNVLVGLDVMRKALHARKHPGISGGSSLLALARQGLPYLTSIGGRARPP